MERYLLPFRLKILGFSLIGFGVLMAVLYFSYNIRIEMPVLAVYSSYIEAKIFAIFRTNIADELTMILFLAGLAFLVFTREKKEKESYAGFRIRAFFLAIISNIVLSAVSIIFIYGSGFIGMLVLNIYATLIFYLLFFNILKMRKQ